MRVAVTGTPGTGKTTATDAFLERVGAGEYEGYDLDRLVPGNVEVVHLNEVVQAEGLYDEVDADRDSVVADMDAIAHWVDEHVSTSDAEVVVLDSHLAHHLDADSVVVLRCRPATLEDRLLERGEPPAKAEENAESEALDVVLSAAVDEHGTERVYEIETTEAAPVAVADEISAVIAGEREPSAGTVDYIDYL